MKNNHISSLDWLRGIAAIMVCFFHFAWANTDYLSINNLLRIISQYGHLGVDIFFVISGFIIPYSLFKSKFKLSNYGKFMLRRFIRIEPPYLISIALYLFLGWLSTFSPYYKGIGFQVSMPGLISHLGYFTALLNLDWINPVYWTLAIEFQFYLVIGLFIVLLRNSKYKYIIYFMIGAMLLSTWLIPDSRLVFHYFPLFLTGIVTFQYKVKILSLFDFIILATCSFISLYIFFPVESLIAVSFAFIFINWVNFETSFSGFLGNISFSVYLIHVPIGSRLVNISENFIKNELLRTCIVFAAVGVSILFAWIYYHYIERRFMILSKKVKY